MVSDTGPWSLGTLIAFPIGVLFTLLLVAAVVFAAYKRNNCDRFDKDGFTMLLAFSSIALLFAAVATAGLMFPYNSEFHQWRHVSGTVDKVSSRVISTGDSSISQRFVVVIDGRAFGVDDTRAALLEKGDHVDLACKKEWQYAADSGWGCRWSD